MLEFELMFEEELQNCATAHDIEIFLERLDGIEEAVQDARKKAEKIWEKSMASRLPVVGNRYKREGQEYKCVGLNLYGTNFYFKMLRDKADLSKEYNLYDFYQFEELSEDKAENETKTKCKNCNSKIEGQIITSNGCCSAFCAENLAEWQKAEIKPETQSHISKLSPEVKEAIRNVKAQLSFTHDNLEYGYLRTREEVRKLLNALDKQQKSGREND